MLYSGREHIWESLDSMELSESVLLNDIFVPEGQIKEILRPETSDYSSWSHEHLKTKAWIPQLTSQTH